MSKVFIYTDGIITYPCPGCKENHGLNIPGQRAHWNWNGDKDKPTFTPSIHRISGPFPDGSIKTICHHFVKDGKIQFLLDFPHELRGQTVEMEDCYEDDIIPPVK